MVRHDGPDRLIRLADVLVTTSDGRPPGERFAALFGEYPGLTLILLVGTGRTVEIGARDGAVASLRLDPNTSVRLAAVAVYHAWVEQFRVVDGSVHPLRAGIPATGLAD